MLRFNNQLLKFNGSLLGTPGIGYYNRLVDYAVSQGIALPSATTLEALRHFLIELYKQGLMPYIMGLHIYAGSGVPEFKNINVINPGTYNVVSYGGLTYSPNGVLGNGINGYVETNFNLNLPDRGKFFIGAVVTQGVNTTEIPANAPLWGGYYALISGTNIDITSGFNIEANSRLYSGTEPSVATYTDTGLFLTLRNGGNVRHIAKGDLTSLSLTISSFTDTPRTLKFLRRDISSISIGYGKSRLGCSVFGEGIDYNKSQIFRTLFNNYLTALGLTPVA